MRILLVEDEPDVAGFIKQGLKQENFAVDVAGDGESALHMAELNPYDLLILDIGLPGKDGISVCRELRNRRRGVPIIMLTARCEVGDRIKGLDSGADDYLGKPFAFDELMARIRALLRRGRTDKSSVLKVADLELDQLRHTVRRAGKTIELTRKEYALLEYLMINVNLVLTRTMISEHIWDANFDSETNVIDVYINYLRRKIDHGRKRSLIRTIRGVGYTLGEKTDEI